MVSGRVLGTMLCGAALMFASTSCRTPPTSAAQAVGEIAGLALEPALGGLRFDRPVYFGVAPGDERVFVVEQHGVVWAVALDGSERSVFLDISDRVTRQGNEEGLIGLAFHPGYASNGRVFVHYSARAGGPKGVVSEFRLGTKGALDPSTERVVLEQDQPWRNHNGGMIAFGPDGYLYVAFGDGGAANDPHGNGQDLATWLASILRIDVDVPGEPESGAAYRVPPDNPFVGEASARPEIWAYGLRNPWRFSFDPATGRLWAGDVGQDSLEEIDIVERGGNYGWKAFEGPASFRAGVTLTTEPHVPPVASYGRQEGESVTGGYVYRGREIPALRGVYVFGDFESGLVWGLVPKGEGYERRLMLDSRKNLASFGQDHKGELYVCAFDGRIYRLVPGTAPAALAAGFPKTLGETGLFASLPEHRVADRVVSYDVNAPLWSDGADKDRHVVLPEGSVAQVLPDGGLQFPEGTTVLKTFTLGEGELARRVETRMIKLEQGTWRAASYAWRTDLSDADLVVDGKAVSLSGTGSGSGSEWHIPSARDCRGCHTDAARFVLGLELPQLDRADQLERLASNGVLASVPSPSEGDWTAMPDVADSGAPLEHRVRAYLHSNCAMCHRPQGPGNANIDLRWASSLDDGPWRDQLVGVEPAQGDLGIDGGKLVTAGQPERSILLQRMDTREQPAMPPLATDRIDQDGVKLVREWIEGLSGS